MGITRRIAGAIGVTLLVASAATADATSPVRPGPSAGLAEIEACVSRNLPETAGRIDFQVAAVDRTGVATHSRAEIQWRKSEGRPRPSAAERFGPREDGGHGAARRGPGR